MMRCLPRFRASGYRHPCSLDSPFCHTGCSCMPRAAFYLAGGSAVSALISIAACQILLVAALVAILLSRQPLQIPRVALPLSVFVLLTLVALALSDDPR